MPASPATAAPATIALLLTIAPTGRLGGHGMFLVVHVLGLRVLRCSTLIRIRVVMMALLIILLLTLRLVAMVCMCT